MFFAPTLLPQSQQSSVVTCTLVTGGRGELVFGGHEIAVRGGDVVFRRNALALGVAS